MAKDRREFSPLEPLRNIIDLMRSAYSKLIILLLLSSCGGIFYFPIQPLYQTPKDYNQSYKDVFIKSKNGNKLHAWHIPAPNRPKSTIVFFHGNAENISTHFLNIQWITKHGHQVFIADYQGYGQSEGHPSQENAFNDALAILTKAYEIHQQTKAKKFIVYGQSLGGNIATAGTAHFPLRDKIDLLVIDSSFMSYQDIAFDKMKSIWLTFPLSPLAYILFSDEHAPKYKLEKINAIPTLVIHGRNDRVIPFKFGKETFSKLTNKKKWFWEIPDGHHTDVFFRHEKLYRRKFLNFLDKEVL